MPAVTHSIYQVKLVNAYYSPTVIYSYNDPERNQIRELHEDTKYTLKTDTEIVKIKCLRL